MRKIVFLITVLSFRLCLSAQVDSVAGLKEAFTTYMQQRMAPEKFRLDKLDRLDVFRGDLDDDGVEDVAIQWRQGQEQQIVTFGKKDDGYEFSAEANCIWIRQKRLVFGLQEIQEGWLLGFVQTEEEYALMPGKLLGRQYLAKIVNGEILGMGAASLMSEISNSRDLPDVRELLILSWPIHHLGGSSILWDVRILWAKPSEMVWDQKHRFVQIHDSLGSEMEMPTTLTAKFYPAKHGRLLLVLTWQEDTNAEWDSQDHWAAFWDRGKWIPATDSVFPPLDGRLFFDPIPDDPNLLQEGWRVALNIQQATDEIIAAPANKLEIIQGAYPELVAKMKAPQVGFVWNGKTEKFELKPVAQ